MRCNSDSNLSLFGLLIVMNFASVLVAFPSYKCNGTNTFAQGSRYSTNLINVMNFLLLNASQTSYGTTSYGESPNKVYGLLQCVGKISAENCSNCSQKAKTYLQTSCWNNIGGRIWMDLCFLRYENYSFISRLDTRGNYLMDVRDVANDVQVFKATTSDLLSKLSEKASDPVNKGFAAGSAKYSADKTVYGLVQCWTDISIKDCRTCLVTAMETVEGCCSSKQGARAMLGSCTLRYENYPFSDEITWSASPQGSTAPTPEKFSKKSATILGILGGVALAVVILLIAMRRKLKSAIFRTPVTVITHNEERHDYTPESELLVLREISTVEPLAEAT